MSAVMDIIVTAQDRASSVIEGVGEAAESTGSWIEDNWAKVTAAAATAGAASEGFARSQAGTNATLSRASIVTGETEDSLRSMIDGMVDHTFSAHDAAAGMDELIRRGVDTRAGFEATLPVFDSFSDATGKDMVESIGTVDQVLGALGIPLEEAGDHIDQFTRLATQTDVPMGTLQRNLARVPDELQALEFGMEDAAAGIEVFRDRGYDGREAVREFRRAVADSEGDMDALLDNLGLTADEFAEYQQQVGEAEGMTDQFAEANNATMTPLERMQANVENLMVRYGGLAEAAGLAAPALIAVGPAMRGVTAATRVLGGAMSFLAANPIVLVIAAVAALAAGLVYLWRNSETFRDIVTGVFDAVGSAGTWLWENALQPAWEAIQGGLASVGDAATAFGEWWGGVMESAGDIVDWLWDSVLDPVWSAVQRGLDNLAAGARAYRDMWLAVFNAVADVVAWAWNSVIRPTWDRLVGGVERIMGWLGNLRDFFGTVWSTIGSTVSSAWGVVRGVWDSIVGFISGPLATAVGSIVGMFSDAWNGAVGIVEEVWGRITGAVRTGVNAAIDVVNSLIDGWNGLSFTFEIPRVEISLPSVLGGGTHGVGGQSTTFSTPNVPTIPRLAEGGIVRARPGGILANIGEGGQDEAVVPLGRGDPFDAIVSELRALRRDMQNFEVRLDRDLVGRALVRGMPSR